MIVFFYLVLEVGEFGIGIWMGWFLNQNQVEGSGWRFFSLEVVVIGFVDGMDIRIEEQGIVEEDFLFGFEYRYLILDQSFLKYVFQIIRDMSVCVMGTQKWGR